MAPERGQMFVPSLMKVIICIPIVRDDHVLSPEKRASGDQRFCKKNTDQGGRTLLANGVQFLPFN